MTQRLHVDKGYPVALAHGRARSVLCGARCRRVEASRLRGRGTGARRRPSGRRRGGAILLGPCVSAPSRVALSVKSHGVGSRCFRRRFHHAKVFNSSSKAGCGWSREGDMRGGAMDRSRPPKTRKASSVKLLKTAPSPSCDAASPTRDVSGLLVGQCCSVARQWTSRDARCATHGAASRDAVATSRDALRRTMDARRRAMAIVRHR